MAFKAILTVSGLCQVVFGTVTREPESLVVSQNSTLVGLHNSTHHGNHTSANNTVDILTLMRLYCLTSPKFGLERLKLDAGQLYCNSSFDKVSCWPTTPAGMTAVIPCPRVYDGVHIQDEAMNATRQCMDNGTWHTWSNYIECKYTPPNTPGDKELQGVLVEVIHTTGATVSLVALSIALFIFIKFRSLHCLRNLIHCHLITTFIAKYLLWFFASRTIRILGRYSDEDAAGQINITPKYWGCRILVSLMSFTLMVNFFWMLVEGLYLYTIIVWAFSADKIKIWPLCLIGYGIPMVFTIIWGICRYYFSNVDCWLPGDQSAYDYITRTPILLVLLLNLFFLGSIIWVLLTKLRATNTLQVKNYKKAVKATFVLLQLLGMTYIFFITPFGDTTTSGLIYFSINAFLQSTQGLAVAVFFCFMNQEVRSALKSYFTRWQDNRNLSTRYSRASVGNQDMLFGSRKNSNALHSLNSFRNGRTQNGGPSRKDYMPDTNGRETHLARPILDEPV